MNEQYSEVAPVESTPFKDRSTGLVVFGILTIGLGCIAGGLVLLMLLSLSIQAAAGTSQVPLSGIIPAIAVYVLLAVALVWLGIGSIMARRWARALMLIFSWTWLVGGIFEIIAMAVIMPKVLRNMPTSTMAGNPAASAAAMDAILVFMFAIYGVIFLIMPAIWTYFYNSRHVKATCEARDPVLCWTDACPLPVLAVCLWAVFSAPMMILMPISGLGVAPFFGMFLTGVAGSAYYIVIGVVWLCAAWLLYKLDQRGWWLILIVMLVMMLSGVITFARHDMMEMYHLMNYPEAQIEQIKRMGIFEGNAMSWMMAFFMVPFLGYLLFIKRYFRPKS